MSDKQQTPRPLGDLAGQIVISPDFDKFTAQDEVDWYGSDNGSTGPS